MKRHTISLTEMADYLAPVILASAASAERGSKRLTMFTNPTSKDVLFQVSTGPAVREYGELGNAITDYNGIDV